MKTKQCKQCLHFEGNSPPDSISPVLYDGRYWRLSHAYPVSMKGWLLIQHKRHVTVLHQLTLDEHLELGFILSEAIPTVQAILGTEREHCVSVGDGISGMHLTFHIIPCLPSFKAIECDDFSQLFACLSPSEQTCLKKDDIIEFCSKFRRGLQLW